MGASLKIWITRAEPGASATAARVRARGHAPVVEPLLHVEPLPVDWINLDGVGALAFTSGNAVRAFAAVSPERTLRVFAVGQTTAAEARQAGFRSVLSSDGDVNLLADRIATRAIELRGKSVLHPGAAEPAGDLVGELEKAGIMARALPLYDTTPVEPDAAFLDTLGELDAVLVHSPKAGKALAALLRKHPAPKLRAFCLSPAVARPLARAKLAGRAAAELPTEDALLNLIDRPS